MSGKKKTLLGRINNLFPTCKEVTLLVVKEQEIELSAAEKMKLFFHANIVCKFCRVFRKQSALLQQHIHKAAEKSEQPAPEFTLDEAEKTRMQSRINELNR